MVNPTPPVLAQLDKRQSAKRDVAGSKLDSRNMYKRDIDAGATAGATAAAAAAAAAAADDDDDDDDVSSSINQKSYSVKSVPGSVTARWLERKQLTWNWYVFPTLNF